MSAGIEEDKTFSKIGLVDIVAVNTFENCRFLNCDFSGANFSGKLFIDCRFEDCNLSLISTVSTGLQNIRFRHCKLSGANFTRCNDFLLEMHFENCILDNAIFFKKKNKKGIFKPILPKPTLPMLNLITATCIAPFLNVLF